MSNIEKLIEEEHARRGINPDIDGDAPSNVPAEPTELPKEEAYDGMRFFVNVNDADGGSVTMHVIHGTWSRRDNKRKLRTYLTELGYPTHEEQKRILKDLGFWSKKQLGTQP